MGCLKENSIRWGISYVLDIARTFIYSGWKKNYNIRKKILSFHIILKYRSLPETSLRLFFKTSTVVAGSESRLQTNHSVPALSQKIQSTKKCWHGTYCWVIGDLVLFYFLMRLLWSWEWPFSHGLQSGSQQQDPQVAIEILEGWSIPGPSDGQEATAWNKGPQSQGRVSMSKGLTIASTGRLQWEKLPKFSLWCPSRGGYSFGRELPAPEHDYPLCDFRWKFNSTLW